MELYQQQNAAKLQNPGQPNQPNGGFDGTKMSVGQQQINTDISKQYLM